MSGRKCIVLFYRKTISSAYSYTRIGKLADASGLVEAVGADDVVITFREAADGERDIR